MFLANLGKSKTLLETMSVPFVLLATSQSMASAALRVKLEHDRRQSTTMKFVWRVRLVLWPDLVVQFVRHVWLVLQQARTEVAVLFASPALMRGAAFEKIVAPCHLVIYCSP